MIIECTGTAIIANQITGEEFEIEADELNWEAAGGTERSMGQENHYQASIEHETLGSLSWNLWEYPSGIENMQSTEVGTNKVVQDFSYNLEHEDERDFEDLFGEGRELNKPEEELKSLDRGERIERMTEWFLSRYEDPQSETPYAMDKESPYNYEYIWGGPYDASEEIGDNFANVASDDEIEAAVEIVQDRDGIYEWAPSSNHPNMRRRDEEALAEQEDEFPSLGFLRQQISEGVNPRFGSDDEGEARADLLTVLEDLKPLIARLDSPPAHGGMGHNHPPEDMALPANISIVITNNITVLQNELSLENPDVVKITETAGVFERVQTDLADFLEMTKDQTKSQGSKALAAAIVSGVGYVSWHILKWLAAALVGLPPL